MQKVRALALCAAMGVWGLAAAQVSETGQGANTAHHDPLPLVFERNAGQLDGGVDFYARGRGFGIALGAGDATLHTTGDGAAPVRLRLDLIGANPTPTATGEGELAAKVSYFKGSDPSRWRAGISMYERARYGGVYPGIDVVYYPNRGALEYDFIVQPGARVEDIRLRFDGAESVALTAQGALELGLPGGTMMQHAPIIYQEIDGRRAERSGRYLQHPDGTLGFVVDEYNRALPLVIDPVLTYSALFTGSAFDAGAGVLSRNIGGGAVPRIFTVGTTEGLTLGSDAAFGAAGDRDVYVALINPWLTGAPSLERLTIVGGTGKDEAVDLGNYSITDTYLIVAGTTNSSDLPVLNALDATLNDGVDTSRRDGFVFAIKEAMTSLESCTYFGGSGDDVVTAMVSNSTRIHLTGTTESADYPITALAFANAAGGPTDAFVSVLNFPVGGPASYTALYSSYLGSQSARPLAIALMDNNRPVIGGTTGSGLNTKNAFQAAHNLGTGILNDGFMAQFNIGATVSVDTLTFNSYIGGSGADGVLGLACTSTEIMLVGESGSADFPSNAGQALSGATDGFVAQVTPLAGTNATLDMTQLLGGAGDDNLSQVVFVDADTLFLAGATASATGIIPAVPDRDPIQSILNAGGSDPSATDVLLYKLAGVSSIPAPLFSIFQSYLGGSGNDAPNDISIDTSGRVYLVGQTSSSNFPQSGSFDIEGYQAAEEGFVCVINDVFFVDPAVFVGVPCGATWDAACSSLENAVASGGNNQEIWVKAGSYTDTGVIFNTGVQVYGGFAGTETIRGQRDWVANRSIMDAQGGSTLLNGTGNARFDGIELTNSNDLGGALVLDTNSNVRVENCYFYNNTADNGGAITTLGSTGVDIVNSIFVNNTANDDGGAIYIGSGGGVTISNCTFAGNESNGTSNDSIATDVSVGTINIFNSIIWGTGANAGQISFTTVTPNVSHCIVEGGFGAGSTIINADPLFVTAPVPGGTLGDVRLQTASPARDQGIDTSDDAGGFVTNDYENKLRYIRGTECIYDLGAFETDLDQPSITIAGDNPLVLEAGVTFADPGATADDGCGDDISADIIVDSSSVDTAALGTYTVTYDVTNSLGVSAPQATRTVEVQDTTPPGIIVLGTRNLTIECGSTYNDVGATASDNLDGDVTADIVVNNAVNAAVPGTYLVQYNVSDSEGNAAATQTRTVTVEDSAAPVITLLGGTVTVSCGGAYTDPGYSANDTCDGDIANNVIVDDSAVDPAAIGSYTVTYDVSDAEGNPAAQQTRTVNVVDSTAPVIAITGGDETIECGGAYVEKGATATDACDASVSVVVGGDTVDAATPGTYVVTYDAADDEGNNAVQKTRTVTVEDTTVPVITLNGGDLTLNCGDSFTEPGASASDTCDGATFVTIGGPAVDTDTPAVYVITYDALDGGGNIAVQRTRTVTVEDNAPPVVTLNGSASEQLECGGTYTDPGATALDDCEGAVAVNVTGTVDRLSVGAHTLTYTATDSSGNVSAPVQRTVFVVDTQAPTIDTGGVTALVVECGDSFVNPTVTATDECDGDLTGGIITTGAVDVQVPGSYTLAYGISDAAGNGSGAFIDVQVLDNVSPAVTVNGANPLVLECGTPFIDPGATANDRCDGALAVQVSSNVDADLPGNYTVTYLAVDGAGRSGSDQRQVIVEDTQAPAITLTGGTVTLECGDEYSEPGFAANDNCDGNLTGGVLVTLDGGAKLDGLTPGTHTLTYSVTDSAGNTGTVDRTIEVTDNNAPQITLIGGPTVSISCGQPYDEPGAIANDACEGDVAVVIGGDTVDPNVEGSYTITYNAQDSAGNQAAQIVRPVNVLADDDPVINLVGTASVTVECGGIYTEEGITATDDCNVDISGSLQITGTVDTATPGTYPITYRVTDADSNVAQVVRVVTVRDTKAPQFTLLGLPVVTVECGGVYTDAGATVADDCDGDLTTQLQIDDSQVDTASPGQYLVTLTVEDAEGNTGTATRTVIVEDSTAPVIALNGAATLNINCGVPFSDPGAVATDACDATLSVAISGAVDSSTPGVYTLHYNTTDSDGNVAAQQTRTVNVIDAAPPQLNLLGAASVAIDCGAAYADAGAAAIDTCAGNLTGSVVTSGTVDASTPGVYTITYNVSDPAGNAATPLTRTVTVRDNCDDEGEGDGDGEGDGAPDGEGDGTGDGEGDGAGDGEGAIDCNPPCDGQPSTDGDGDGLTACEEDFFGTSDLATDSDGDGMADSFEALYCPVLDPTSDADGNDNPDGDGFDNLNEFLNQGDPLDADSPARNVYVSLVGGVDSPGRGTRGAPFATIGFALRQVQSTQDNPVNILLYDGAFMEDVVMQPGLAIMPVPGAIAAIAGTIVGAEGAVLSDLTIAPRRGGVALLRADNIGMRIIRCVFRGSSRRDSTGIVITGGRARDVIIENCIFERLAVGIDVDAGHPAMRFTRFGNISGAGMIIRCSGQSGLSQFSGDDARTGYNTFLPSIDGPAVINECPFQVNMERNDWGVDNPTPDTIAGVIVGNVNFADFLVTGGAVFSGALFATVWDAGDQAPITNAQVSLTPTLAATVTDNRQGVYTFPALGSGSYSVQVKAPGYAPQTVQANVSDGQILSITIALRFTGEEEGEASVDEGEGEGEDPGTGGCPCNQGDKLGPPQPADFLITAIVAATLLASTLSLRRQRLRVS